MNEIEAILSKGPLKGKDVFIAPGAVVMGNVELADESSVWFNAVLRADSDKISIGKRSNIQDNSVIHVDPGCPVNIGHDCIIGHSAIVHGASMGDHVLIGMRATLLNNVKIGNFCIIGANSLLTEGMEVPDFSLVLGSPAKIIRQISDVQKDKIRKNADVYVNLAKCYLKYYDSLI